jgi:hypothetical protein
VIPLFAVASTMIIVVWVAGVHARSHPKRRS